jgi:hypothetical protein
MDNKYEHCYIGLTQNVFMVSQPILETERLILIPFRLRARVETVDMRARVFYLRELLSLSVMWFDGSPLGYAMYTSPNPSITSDMSKPKLY